MRLGSHCGGGARVCMHWDGWGVCGGGRSESGWVRIGGSLTKWFVMAVSQCNVPRINILVELAL